MYVDPGLALTGLAASGIFATAGAIIGSTRDQAGTGAMLGMLLGPLGLICITAMGPTQRERRRRAEEDHRLSVAEAERKKS